MRSPVPSFLSASVLFALALAGCATVEDKSSDDPADSVADTDTDTYVAPTDADADGVTPGDGDCDDNNADLYPGRAEDCDGIDNNCNGQVDEGQPDSDADGTADCTDSETCDGIDNDGDAQIDEDFIDADHDGVADCRGTEVCDGADNDSDGEIDEGFDADGDGFVECGTSEDCNDTDASVNPGADEIDGDLIDNDCDGTVDDNDWAEGDLAISEIMNNPGVVGDPDGEWFEVYNTTSRMLILNGIVLSDSAGEIHAVRSDEILALEPGDFFVFGSNGDAATNGDANVGYVFTGFTLSNETDDISIWADGIMIDEVAWDDGLTMPDPDAASMGNDRGNYDSWYNDDPTTWCVATNVWTLDRSSDRGSPGDDNELCSTVDHDGDGYTADGGDCDDEDTSIHPDAFEGSDPVDNDCDGDDEIAPTAVATATSSGYLCDALTLDGTGSYDSEGDMLSYSWELTGAPSGSSKTTADIEETTDATPTFVADVAGTYTFTLTVNDGGTDSYPVSVSIDVADRPHNFDPVADAGADQSSSGTADCTPISYGVSYSCTSCSAATFSLDASGSSDPDGDDLSYAWSVVSGSTYGSLTRTSGSSATLQISGITAVYSTGATETVTVQVEVTDCMGASDTDTVDVSYTCTGT